MSLKLRANVFFAILLLLSMLGSAAILMTNAKRSVEAEVMSTMDATAHIITVTLAGGPLTRDTGVSEHMHELVRALSEIRSLHILLFDRQGLMFEGTPEKELTVQPPAWFVKLLFPDVSPLSKRFGTGHMVIYPAPMQEISERWQDIRAIMALGMIIFVVVAFMIYWGVGWVIRPLQRLLDALAGFERGDLHMRLPRFSLKEMDQISQSFNRVGDALEQSTTENRRLAMLVRQSGDAILSLDHAGYITFCNAAAERLFSDIPNLLGESLASMPFQHDRNGIISVLNGFESVENLETTLKRNDDELLSLLISTVPLTENDGCVAGMICTLRDITEHKQAEKARAQLYETRLLTNHMNQVQEAERRHLARELHDELGQCLTAIKTDAVLIRNRSEETDKKIYQSAQAIIDTASHIYDVVHNMITRLRPSPLDDLGLMATLQESISKWQQRQPDIQFNLITEGQLNGFDEDTNMTVFRVVQEALTNAVRHADAENILVKVIRDKNETTDQLTINIRDDGKGMVVNDFHSDVDFGLLGMRERAQSLGGSFDLQSQLGSGVNLTITIPLGVNVHHES
ncbi:MULTISPECIES: histidine kinase [unclassified Methylophaga]|jgi:PAS domain S-box-containing protein|uniref:histidine kinase n=1 Tax=unclassified Methylophaga TaxID=2629249 RepID=UPI000C8ADFB7|nr:MULTISPECIES: histidine kinase [unclassified Methylophaga]MAK68083.1 methanol utilization protein MoxY [Methylophaga sp.]MAY16858.1 methanol utilization protein MoxY [Methylophaga sp.]HAO25885.1 methanol utilization protein MoxY [Methylophaga sp.]|tara:strand:+ start:43942 stop:45657 length:1716 start_codon:yes stop_codon:yes gene_type:complete